MLLVSFMVVCFSCLVSCLVGFLVVCMICFFNFVWFVLVGVAVLCCLFV